MSASPRISYPPDPNPKKPQLAMPAGAWDTHFHVCGPPHLFPYKDFPNFIPPAAPIEHYLAVAAVLGFERGVVVQHSIHGTDSAVTVDAIRKSDGRICGMILADSDLTAIEVKRLHAAGVRGIRIELTEKLHGAYDETVFDKLVALAASASWVVALHLDPASIERHADKIRRLPTQTILENYAHVDPRDGLDQPALRTLLDLAREPHIWLKTASAYRMLRRGASYDLVTKMARLVHEASPDKVIWGTDWPHGDVFLPGQMANDGDIVDMLLDFVPDATARRKLLVDNPRRLFDSRRWAKGCNATPILRGCLENSTGTNPLHGEDGVSKQTLRGLRHLHISLLTASASCVLRDARLRRAPQHEVRCWWRAQFPSW